MELDLHLLRWGGATTTRLLQADGFTTRDIRQAVATGRLLRVRRGAFMAPAEHELARARAAVAVARTRPGAVLSHASAVAAAGLPVRGRWSCEVDLMVPGVTRMESRAHGLRIRRLRGETTPLRDWPDVGAVTLADALCDVAADGHLEGLVSIDAALHRNLVTVEELAQAAMAQPRKAPQRVAAVLAEADGSSESPGETELRHLLRRLGIATRSQVEFFDDHGFVGRVDLYDPATRTVYEFDGLTKYEGAGGRDALVREKRREDRLRRLGLRIVRVTWADLTPSRLARLVWPERGLGTLAG